MISCHEDLHDDQLRYRLLSRNQRTRSKAVEQARGWVATKMGFFDIFVSFAREARSRLGYFSK